MKRFLSLLFCCILATSAYAADCSTAPASEDAEATSQYRLDCPEEALKADVPGILQAAMGDPALRAKILPVLQSMDTGTLDILMGVAGAQFPTFLASLSEQEFSQTLQPAEYYLSKQGFSGVVASRFMTSVSTGRISFSETPGVSAPRLTKVGSDYFVSYAGGGTIKIDKNMPQGTRLLTQAAQLQEPGRKTVPGKLVLVTPHPASNNPEEAQSFTIPAGGTVSATTSQSFVLEKEGARVGFDPFTLSSADIDKGQIILKGKFGQQWTIPRQVLTDKGQVPVAIDVRATSGTLTVQTPVALPAAYSIILKTPDGTLTTVGIAPYGRLEAFTLERGTQIDGDIVVTTPSRLGNVKASLSATLQAKNSLVETQAGVLASQGKRAEALDVLNRDRAQLTVWLGEGSPPLPVRAQSVHVMPPTSAAAGPQVVLNNLASVVVDDDARRTKLDGKVDGMSVGLTYEGGRPRVDVLNLRTGGIRAAAIERAEEQFLLFERALASYNTDKATFDANKKQLEAAFKQQYKELETKTKLELENAKRQRDAELKFARTNAERDAIKKTYDDLKRASEALLSAENKRAPNKALDARKDELSQWRSSLPEAHKDRTGNRVYDASSFNGKDFAIDFVEMTTFDKAARTVEKAWLSLPADKSSWQDIKPFVVTGSTGSTSKGFVLSYGDRSVSYDGINLANQKGQKVGFVRTTLRQEGGALVASVNPREVIRMGSNFASKYATTDSFDFLRLEPTADGKLVLSADLNFRSAFDSIPLYGNPGKEVQKVMSDQLRDGFGAHASLGRMLGIVTDFTDDTRFSSLIQQLPGAVSDAGVQVPAGAIASKVTVTLDNSPTKGLDDLTTTVTGMITTIAARKNGFWKSLTEAQAFEQGKTKEELLANPYIPDIYLTQQEFREALDSEIYTAEIKKSVRELAQVRIAAQVYGAGPQAVASSSTTIEVTPAQIETITEDVKARLIQQVFKGQKEKYLPFIVGENEGATNPADYKLGNIFKQVMGQLAPASPAPSNP